MFFLPGKINVPGGVYGYQTGVYGDQNKDVRGSIKGVRESGPYMYDSCVCVRGGEEPGGRLESMIAPKPNGIMFCSMCVCMCIVIVRVDGKATFLCVVSYSLYIITHKERRGKTAK